MPLEPSIGLVGYRGSGKSTVGRLLAERLGRSHVDVDEAIVTKAGMTIKEIFRTSGEPAFRDLESACIREIVLSSGQVISFGGGALDREENRQAIADAKCELSYLRCEPAELLRRIQSDPLTTANRPNLTPFAGGIDEIETILARREPIWRAAVNHEIDVTHLSPQHVVERLIALL